MYITEKELIKIDEVWLNDLISNQISENKYIEYKLTLPSESNDDKKEFLADVSSFANSDGGVIFYGIKAEDGIAAELSGLTMDSPDAVVLRIENILRTCLEPRIINYKIKPIKLSNDKFILIIYITKSINSPHVVNYNKHWRFYARNSAGKYPLDVNEVKSLFLRSESLSENIKNFRTLRLEQIIGGNSPVQLKEGGKFVLHIIPIDSFYENRQEIFTPNKFPPRIETEYSYPYSFINIDGRVYHNQFQDNPADQYIQVFRNGSLEIVKNSFLESETKLIKATSFEECYIEEFPMYISLINILAIPKPYLVFLSVVNIQYYDIKERDNFQRMVTGRHPIDRNFLLIPDILLTEDDQDDFGVVLKPIFDPIWNSCGYPGSCNYQDGKWVKKYNM